MSPRSPRVLSIPHGAPFLATLTQALLRGEVVEGCSKADGPLGLAAATIYVPTRRAAQALADTIAQAWPGPAVLLPRILPLGRLDADTAGVGDEPGSLLDPDLPSAVGDTARRLILTRLVARWAEAVSFAILSVDAQGRRKLDPSEPLLVARSPADAWRLSGELASLIDELIIEGVEWGKFEPLGLGVFDDYWRITMDFLAIAIRSWPDVLAERGLVDRATRQIRLVDKEIARLAQATGPVVIAGSTGSNRATARLMAAVARAPRGAVVLQGLDLELDGASWDLVGQDGAAGHPQAALHRLLPRLGVARADVREIGRAPPVLAGRVRFLGEALRPAETTDLWKTRQARLPDAAIAAGLRDVVLIEAPDERAEALAVAVVLRETLETAGATAALVTPDRDLARRVRAELGRWEIEAEDSGGEPLARTPIGTIARLTLACVAGGCAPADLLALLAHPLARFGRAREDLERLTQALEIGVLRGRVPADALNDIPGLIAGARAGASEKHAHPSRRHIGPELWGGLEALLEAVKAALAPLASMIEESPLPAWVAAHRASLEQILRGDAPRPATPGHDGAVLADLFDTLCEEDARPLTFEIDGYAAFFDSATADISVRGSGATHPRIRILGLLEARLLQPDVVVLGGLDETIWPPQPATGAFLNRPMRAALGLTPPERRIGQTAHDFVAALGTPRVVLSRATKRGGTPTVMSRFLQRMAALAGKEPWADCRKRGERYLAWARALDRPGRLERIAAPEPRPPVELRPTKLSVTRIETLRRDPYAIYAEQILKLAPLEALDAKLDASDFGTGLHQVIADFSCAFPGGELPADVPAYLAQSARKVFAAMMEDADFVSWQWPRLQRNIAFFAGWESERRVGIAELHTETRGELAIPLPSGSAFRLTAIADRIEARRDGTLAVIDYKTGQPPGLREVQVGFAPQLTLEAAMAARGAFGFIPAGKQVAGAAYVRLGGDMAGGKVVALEWKSVSFADVVEKHYGELVGLLDSFADETTPYVSRPFPKYASRFGAYDHLARVGEWSTGNAEDAESP